MPMRQLTPEESAALDAITNVQLQMRRLFDGLPWNWEEEALPAIHVLQSFVKQHYCHRLNPDEWSDWSPDSPPTWPSPNRDERSDNPKM